MFSDIQTSIQTSFLRPGLGHGSHGHMGERGEGGVTEVSPFGSKNGSLIG